VGLRSYDILYSIYTIYISIYIYILGDGAWCGLTVVRALDGVAAVCHRCHPRSSLNDGSCILYRKALFTQEISLYIGNCHLKLLFTQEIVVYIGKYRKILYTWDIVDATPAPRSMTICKYSFPM
jgi:hypothetical protein